MMLEKIARGRPDVAGSGGTELTGTKVATESGSLAGTREGDRSAG